MSIPDVEKILHSLNSSSNLAFSFSSSVSTERLKLSVKDVGEIKFPVNKTTIKKLIKHASPAMFGHKDKTIYDPRIRNTWELDKSYVKIDMRKWKRDLNDVLNQMSHKLFPDGTELAAELHNMLVYEPGQFFKKHQDSEKNEGMQASLVVMLPTKEDLRGGNLSIEHVGNKKVYGKHLDADKVQYIGFYADCVHQVTKVTVGHRLALTFNISIKSKGVETKNCPSELVEEVKKFFNAPLKSRYARVQESSIFCLLGHQYTPKNLGWGALKGSDIAPALALKSAAEHLDFAVYLGNFEYKVTYDVFDNDYYDYRNRRNEIDKSTSDYQTGEVLDEAWKWVSCIDVKGKKVRGPDCSLYDASKIELGGLDELEIEDEEYEGYMGNYGNTLDRLYHRAGILIFDPKASAFLDSISNPLVELKRIANLKNKSLVDEELERYFPYVQCFPTERRVIEQIVKIGVKFESPELLSKLISERHYYLLFTLSARCLMSLDDGNKAVVEELMFKYIKRSGYGDKRVVMALLKTSALKPAICEKFSNFLPYFIELVTSGAVNRYCFDREGYADQVNKAAMVFKFASNAGCFKRSLPLLNHIEECPLAYPVELLVLELPPNEETLRFKQVEAFYRNCWKELSSFVEISVSQDTGSAVIPLEDFFLEMTSARRDFFRPAPSEKCKELLSFLKSNETEIRLPLFKKDQEAIRTFIFSHKLPVEYSFGSASSRYYVNYKKSLKVSKSIWAKRIEKSQEALVLLESLL